MRERKKTGKSLISLFVCFSMVVTMIPSIGWAESADKGNPEQMPATENIQQESATVENNQPTTEPQAEPITPMEQNEEKENANLEETIPKENLPSVMSNTDDDGVSMKTLGFTVEAKTTANLNVRKSASASSQKLGSFTSGTKIIIKGFVKNKNGTWYETTYKGKRGYVSGDYVNVYNYTFPHRTGHTTNGVQVYRIGSSNMIEEYYQIPKNKDVAILNRILTNKGNAYRVKYNGKIGYALKAGLNTDPIVETFKMPMTLKVKLGKNVTAYKNTYANAAKLYTMKKGSQILISEKIVRQSYQWYKGTYNGKTVYCRINDVNIIGLTYKNRTGKALENVPISVEANGHVETIATIPKGEYFDLLGRIYTTGNSIYKIAYKGKTGYILFKDVNFNPIMESFVYPDKPVVKLKKDTKMYGKTTIDNQVLYTAPKGTEIKISEKIYRSVEPWYKTTYKGKTVYCKSDEVDIRSEVLKNEQRNVTGAFVLFKEVSNKSTRLKTVPVKKKVNLLARVKTEKTVYLQIKYGNITGYAIENNIKNLISKDYIIDCYDFGLEVKGEITSDTALYEDSSVESKAVYHVKKGTKLSAIGVVEKNTGEWYKVLYNGKKLYVSEKHAKILRQTYSTIVMAYNKSAINLRSGLGTQASVKCVIPDKGIMQVKEKYQTTSGNWFKVEHNGYTGYVKGSGIAFKDVGIDVSKYNTDINWKKVKSSGIDFVFIRLGFTGYGNGVQVEDPYFESHINGAINAGLDVGVYYFTQAINTREAKKEVDFAVKLLEPYKEHITLPLVVDSEFISSSRPGRADHLSKQARTEVLDAFCQRVEYRGYDPMIYMSKSWITGQLNYEGIKQYPIWVAQYNICNTTPQPYDYWQYTSGGYVPGISGRVDMNIKL